MDTRITHRLLVASLAATALSIPLIPAASAKAAPQIAIDVLSGRADLVSDGSALIALNLPHGAGAPKVTVNGRDVSPAFSHGPDGRLQGLVDGLKLGANTLTASAANAHPAHIVLTDHPIGGPVFSGPQIQPWACQSGALDKQCNAPTTSAYSYLPAGSEAARIGASGVASFGLFQPYDPAKPPPAGSIATTTTDTGETVPFIVRTETGYLDRDQFATAVLYQPEQPWTPVSPQAQFNRKLVLTHGASCDTTYGTGTAPSVMDPALLGHGYVLASHALDNAGHNCNLATEAESLIMTKEHVIKTYGALLWTIGSGCSGGSLVQQQVANAYPGVYQAITPQCSFTDAWSSAMEYEDYYMLLKYFQDPSRWDPGTVWSPLQIQAVLDHPNIGNPVTFTNVIPNSGNPSRSCPSVPSGQVYNPQTNPGGVKCTLQDYMVNVFGTRPDGFANRPFDNTGIQYGLDGLRTGILSPAQFVDLNTHLGGLDYSGNLQGGRIQADLTGLDRAYTSGAVDSANNLDQVAIIDLRGPDPGAFHDVYRTYAMRDRLLRNFGTAANQVLWRGQAPIIGDPSYADAAVLAADQWVARFTADQRPIPLARKIREDKPGTLANRCTDGNGHDVPFEVCDQTVAAYGTPRFAADAPKTDDVLKCQLKPLAKDDYPVVFTAAEWANLQRAFPTGVCNYGARGVKQHGTTPWLTYQTASGSVVYGGRPLGPPPRSS
ncbi:MAG: DUF6351 family protein [Acidimicrobiales bacterium]